ncbi:MAG TPA: DivIVA domain-containing protein [Ilumatobacteraceae bacterium]|nr:DivIVA domain-containing protein [Ilumatobacteraceae bacterium]HRB04310.1 DivIVA domain-containing protein [Ilumatobacteraceae bacterium]
MDISPQTIRSTGFKTVKKGYDPDEVESFRSQVAAAVETAQNQATAMEARARAAVAKLQEVSQQVAGTPRDTAAPSSHSGDTEVISRTLLLAQRTADTTIMEARTEADGITAQARDEASRVLDSARTMATKTVEDSRLDARRAVEDERVRAENEVQSLLARRDFLLGDVDHLEQYLQSQRERLRDAAVQLQELVDRVPGGLGDMRRPLLSASAEPQPASAPPAQPSTPSAPAAPADAAAAPGHVDEAPDAGTADHSPGEGGTAADSDPSPLFMQLPDRAAGLSALAMSGDAAAQDDVWRLLDEEVASTQASQASLALGDVTAEVPVTPAPVEQPDPFSIGGDELN